MILWVQWPCVGAALPSVVLAGVAVIWRLHWAGGSLTAHSHFGGLCCCRLEIQLWFLPSGLGLGVSQDDSWFQGGVFQAWEYLRSDSASLSRILLVTVSYRSAQIQGERKQTPPLHWSTGKESVAIFSFTITEKWVTYLYTLCNVWWRGWVSLSFLERGLFRKCDYSLKVQK